MAVPVARVGVSPTGPFTSAPNDYWQEPIVAIQYLYRLRPTRPAMLSEGPTAEEQRVVGEHFAHLKHLAEQGTVILAGRTLNADPTAFGLVIFTAASEEAALALMRADPAVRQGVMAAELFPYRFALLNPGAAAG